MVPNFPLATNGGLTRGDVLAAPVAAAHRGVNDERLTGARVSLLIKPSDALTITPGVFYQRIGQGGENAYDSDPGPPAHYQLGRLLFIRHSGGISLTDSGVLLYQHAEHVLKGMQRLTDEMAADNQVPRGLVSMGAPPSMQSTLTAPVAARFIKAFPHAFLNVIQDTSARLREGVLKNGPSNCKLEAAVQRGAVSAYSCNFPGVKIDDLVQKVLSAY